MRSLSFPLLKKNRRNLTWKESAICADQDNNEVLVPGKSVLCALG